MFTPLLLTLSLGCPATDTTETTDDSATSETDSGTDTTDTQETDTIPSGPKGCVKGRLKDYDNHSGADLTVTAFYGDSCLEIDTVISAVDGKFCLDDLPVDHEVQVVATFAKQCSWPHAKQVTATAAGTCSEHDCLNVDSWFECEGETATCP